MARTTVSIPDDLKKRMDRCKEPINWSAVAAEAFEIKLGEFARNQKEKTMDAVVARLRASKIEHASGLRKEGHECGEKWAKTHAEYDELVNAANLNTDEISEMDDSSAYGPWEVVASKILGVEVDRQRDFWEGVLGDADDKRLESVEFIAGFCEGARWVWEKVNSKL